MDNLRPTLRGSRVTIRPGDETDIPALRAIGSEESVTRWWDDPDSPGEIAADLRGENESVLLVIELDGRVAGGIQYHEELTPKYRHAGIDIYLGSRYQGQGAGAEAIALLASFLLDKRGHHRITIDPAASNIHAIKCYGKVGFRPVGLMREYERGEDGTFHDGLLMDLLRTELNTAYLPPD